MSNIKILKDTEAAVAVKNFLNATLKEIMTLLRAECGSLFLFDGDNKELVLDSLYNSQSNNLVGLRQRIGEGVAGKVVDISAPVLVKDIDLDPRFRKNGYTHYHTKSFISIPLFSSLGLIGVLSVTDKSNGEPFSEKDFNFAVSLTRYACLTVDNLVSCIGLKEEKDILDKQKAVLEKYASVGKLAAGIVHEVNNPLDGVIRYTNMLIPQMDNNSIGREYLLEIKNGLSRIANITKSLLEFSQQVNLNATHTKNYTELHELIDESLVILNERMNDKIIIDRQYKDNMPKVLDLGLSHVAINIIKNAIDAMPDGGALKISTDITDSGLQISFQDTGIGMPREVAERIFDPFFSTKENGKGTGLGLSICNEVVNKYEGRIDVRSSLGKGSVFTVLIPKKYLKNA